MTFSLQIEIQGDNGLFSAWGGSRALVVDENNYAVGLLCSVRINQEAGGQLSIGTVPNALNVDLLI